MIGTICDKCSHNHYIYCSKDRWQGEPLPGFVDENCPDFEATGKDLAQGRCPIQATDGLAKADLATCQGRGGLGVWDEIRGFLDEKRFDIRTDKKGV